MRNFICSEINTFRLPKFSKISFVCNIFDPIPVQEMVLFKGYTKQSPQLTFLCREPSIIKRIWKKLGGASAPLSPPGSAYAITAWIACSGDRKFPKTVGSPRRVSGYALVRVWRKKSGTNKSSVLRSRKLQVVHRPYYLLAFYHPSHNYKIMTVQKS